MKLTWEKSEPIAVTFHTGCFTQEIHQRSTRRSMVNTFNKKWQKNQDTNQYYFNPMWKENNFNYNLITHTHV